MAKLSTNQQFALIQETETSIFLIHEGLIALNALGGANDFYHAPMQLRGQGIERLMKLIICLARLEAKGKLPAKGEMSKYSHDLTVLAKAVVEIGNSTGYADSRPAAKSDIQFIANNERLGALLSSLADFGEWGRYYNLDTLLDPAGSVTSRVDPIESFQRIDNDILNEYPEWKSRIGQDFQGFYGIRNAELITTLQRFARALCRYFTLGPLGDKGRQLLGAVQVFLFLMDHDLSTVPARWYER